MPRQISSKDLTRLLSSLKEDVPVKVFCSFNHYDIKNVVLFEGKVIIEVGDTNNRDEEFFDGPMIA